MNQRPQYASAPCWLHEFEDEVPRFAWQCFEREPSAEDGLRVLIDPAWPRDRERTSLAVETWARSLVPSASLRRRFGGRPENWERFRADYQAELAGKHPSIEKLLARAGTRNLTFLTNARDHRHNPAIVLVDYLRRHFA